MMKTVDLFLYLVKLISMIVLSVFLIKVSTLVKQEFDENKPFDVEPFKVLLEESSEKLLQRTNASASFGVMITYLSI